MQAKKATRSFLPLTIIFIITNGLFLSGRSLFGRWNIDTDVLIIGNLVLFLATLISFLLYNRSLSSKNAFAILRMIYAGLFVKLMLCAASAFIYIMAFGNNVNKGAIFCCMFLYIVYSAAEVTILMKLSKQNRNA
jgi:hypothetical protein